ncbi:MAG: HpcH/HpaI aldolase family protein [Planctomycetota bacterium]|jgi:4-hydroxy-2-oxoheptanedioate aldolase
MDITELIRHFRQRIAEGPVFGPFSKTSDPAIVETLGHAGFDFIILDMEHGPNSIETVQNVIRAAQLAEMAPIVRIPSGDYEMIGKALDVGAAGVQVPQVSCAQDVRVAIKHAKFAPLGMRGVCRYVRAAGYSSMDKTDYFRRANETLLIIQIEGQAALDNLDEILAVDGVDIVFVGPYDLSQSLGVPGEVEHPLVIEKMKQIVEVCLGKGVFVGNFTETIPQTEMWVAQGLRYMSYSVDVGIVYEAGKALLSDFNRIRKNGGQ